MVPIWHERRRTGRQGARWCDAVGARSVLVPGDEALDGGAGDGEAVGEGDHRTLAALVGEEDAAAQVGREGSRHHA